MRPNLDLCPRFRAGCLYITDVQCVDENDGTPPVPLQETPLRLSLTVYLLHNLKFADLKSLPGRADWAHPGMTELSAAEKAALRVIQCSLRCALSRRQLRQLSSWFEEEQKWRQALKRRRARIERLERELRHVENMPAMDVDRYAATARYGMRGVEAAVQTIQGAWRSLVRARRRLLQRLERRNRAAAVLQCFFKKYAKLRRKIRCAAAPSHSSCPACTACLVLKLVHISTRVVCLRRLGQQQMQSQGATPKKHSAGDNRRPRDETPWELPSVQVVRAMQAKITSHLEAWRKAGGMQRPRTDEDLQDLSQVRLSILTRSMRKADVGRPACGGEAASTIVLSNLPRCCVRSQLQPEHRLAWMHVRLLTRTIRPNSEPNHGLPSSRRRWPRRAKNLWRARKCGRRPPRVTWRCAAATGWSTLRRTPI